jgi:hypothetical protein
MTTQQVADRLVELCRKGEFVRAEQELYGPNIVHVEFDGKEFTGYETVLQKEVQFLAKLKAEPTVEVSDPIVAGDYFTIRMYMHCEHEDRGKININEIIIYKVTDGKIVYLKCYL